MTPAPAEAHRACRNEDGLEAAEKLGNAPPLPPAGLRLQVLVEHFF